MCVVYTIPREPFMMTKISQEKKNPNRQQSRVENTEDLQKMARRKMDILAASKR